MSSFVVCNQFRFQLWPKLGWVRVRVGLIRGEESPQCASTYVHCSVTPSTQTEVNTLKSRYRNIPDIVIRESCELKLG